MKEITKRHDYNSYASELYYAAATSSAATTKDQCVFSLYFPKP